MNKFKYEGTISHGTLRPEDLIPRFLEVLKELDRDLWEDVVYRKGADSEIINDVELNKSLDSHDSEQVSDFLNYLMDKLEESAPADYTFGTHEGDGSDFGFWKIEDTLADDQFALDDCANYETNTLGDCGGRVERVGTQVLCETCRNRGIVQSNRRFLTIEVDSDAGRHLANSFTNGLVYKVSLEPRANDTVAIKVNEGMWTPALNTKGD